MTIPEQAVEKAAEAVKAEWRIRCDEMKCEHPIQSISPKNYRLLRAALSAAAPFMAAQWQPIETAPKDGTKIIVYTVHGEIELSDWFEIPHWDYEEAEGGLYRKVITGKTAAWNSNNPTHWQPLPAAPIIAD